MMELSFLLTFAMFSFVMSGTPGPNNIMLLASGAQFGFYRTLPHMVGIVLGMIVSIGATLLGLGALFVLYPSLYLVLKWVGGAYLLWLAWKIASAPVSQNFGSGKSQQGKPMTWWQAALFQFVNPKAWMMSISTVSTFTLPGDQYVLSGLWILAVFVLVNFPTISMWAWCGVSIRRWLTDAKRQRTFNLVMGAATALTLMMIVRG